MNTAYKFLLFSLFLGFSSIIPIAPKQSVGDVFSDQSPEQIAAQVDMAQQYMAYLEAPGATPEEESQKQMEREAFSKMMEETIANLTPDDWKDIEDIAKLVEPMLTTPTADTTPTLETTPTTAPAPSVTTTTSPSDDTEAFQETIASIQQRIDDILQKFNSSKECSEYVDIRWGNKATLSNMTRQIAQLKIKRLAQKFVKSDISDDDAKLKKHLVSFLKELTEFNQNLVIEDDFGIPVSRETEKAHLKKAKEILQMFDEYIDSLMPMLEKFLTKWDPEALQLAKEAETKTKSALKDATDATQRRASPDARPAQNAYPSYPNQTSTSANAYNQGGYYPADYYDSSYPQQGYSNYGSENASGSQGNSPALKTPTTAPKQPQSENTAKADAKKKEQSESSKIFDSITEALEDYAELYSDKSSQELIKFINEIPTKYPQEPKDKSPAGTSTWFTQELDPYIETSLKTFKTQYHQQFKNIANILSDILGAIKDLDSNHAKNINSLAALVTIESRLNSYIDAYGKMDSALKTKFDNYKTQITDLTVQPMYIQKHTAFIDQLKTDIKIESDDALANIALIRSKARKRATRAPKDSEKRS